jgi:hypothetical protein
MKMELRDATPERLGYAPNIDLKATQLVSVSFEQNVSEYTRVDTGEYITDGYETNGLFNEEPAITEWNASREYGVVRKISEPGFLRGFPVMKSKNSSREERCIELFFNYTDIYGSSLVVSLNSLSSMYLHSPVESRLEALKHDTETDHSIEQLLASVTLKGRNVAHTEIELSYELLDSFIVEAAKNPKEKVFDFGTDDLHGAYVTDSPTGLMVVRQKPL